MATIESVELGLGPVWPTFGGYFETVTISRDIQLVCVARLNANII